jgi:hypothetical protein
MAQKIQKLSFLFVTLWAAGRLNGGATVCNIASRFESGPSPAPGKLRQIRGGLPPRRQGTVCINLVHYTRTLFLYYGTLLIRM